MDAIKKYWRPVLTCVLAAIFAVSLIVIMKKQFDYWDGENEYALAQQEVGLTLPAATVTPAASQTEQTAEETAPAEEEDAEPEDPIVTALLAIDLDALRDENPDVIGWILIPDTEISYPLLQGGDNDYYLDHTYKGEENSVGSIFLDYRLNSSLENFNTIIYGHRMRNGSMFGGLKYYVDQSYYEQHPTVYIALESGVYRYDIFAAYEASVEGAGLQRSFVNETERAALIDQALSNSAIDTGIEPTVDDHILTLSTCTGRGYTTRWVVQAVRRDTAG